MTELVSLTGSGQGLLSGFPIFLLRRVPVCGHPERDLGDPEGASGLRGSKRWTVCPDLISSPSSTHGDWYLSASRTCRPPIRDHTTTF